MSLNTVLLLTRETSSSLRQLSPNTTSYTGFLLKVSVYVAFNIYPKIFVMQRDVSSSYSDGLVDTFYSVASVGELEWIPEDNPNVSVSNFFRTDSIELMFESPKDLEDAWIAISTEALSLAECNDISINTEPDIVAIYPQDAFPRYYGNSTASPDSSDVVGLGSDITFSNVLSFSEVSDGTNYFTFAYPALLGLITATINGTPLSLAQSTMSMTNTYGSTIVYNVYTSSSALPPGSNSILSTKA